MEKTCTKCRSTKDTSEFGRNKNNEDGKNMWCLECSRRDRKRYYKANRDAEKASALARYHRNSKDPDFRERRNARQRKYAKEYGKRPKTRKLQAKWSKTYTSKPGARISRRMGFQIWTSLRNKLTGKSKKAGRHWEEIVDFTLAELMAHLESKFRDGMSWENYGGEVGWQIDHITPRSWFDIDSTDGDAFKSCWALDNLQPLWLSENASKGNRFAG